MKKENRKDCPVQETMAETENRENPGNESPTEASGKKQGAKEKVQLVKGFFRDDYEIVKRTMPDGSVYEHPNGRKLTTCEGDLYGMISQMITKFQFISDFLYKSDEDEDYRISNILNCVIKDAECKLAEIFHTIDKCIGNIEVTYLAGDNIVYRDHRCLNAELTPADLDAENGISFDHDPELVEYLKSLPPGQTGPLKAIIRVLKNGHSFTWHPVERGQ